MVNWAVCFAIAPTPVLPPSFGPVATRYAIKITGTCGGRPTAGKDSPPRLLILVTVQHPLALGM
jgi:hypothetical protein